MIGAAAVPSLAAALKDRDSNQIERTHMGIPAPLELILELLVPHGPDHVWRHRFHWPARHQNPCARRLPYTWLVSAARRRCRLDPAVR